MLVAYPASRSNLIDDYRYGRFSETNPPVAPDQNRMRAITLDATVDTHQRQDCAEGLKA
jgi:hypothetical protein